MQCEEIEIKRLKARKMEVFFTDNRWKPSMKLKICKNKSHNVIHISVSRFSEGVLLSYACLTM